MAVFTSNMRFTGFSGIDTNDMVRQIMNAESMRLHQLQRQRQRLQWQQQDLRGVSNTLQAFQQRFLRADGAHPIHLPSNMMGRNVNITGEGITASASSSAAPGTWTVETHNLATSGQLVGSAGARQVSASNTLDVGRIGANDSIRIGLNNGASREINIGQIASSINSPANTTGSIITGDTAFDFTNIQAGDTITVQAGTSSVTIDLYEVVHGRQFWNPNIQYVWDNDHVNMISDGAGGYIQDPINPYGAFVSVSGAYMNLDNPTGFDPVTGEYTPQLATVADEAEFLERLNERLLLLGADATGNIVNADIDSDGNIIFVDRWLRNDMSITGTGNSLENIGFTESLPGSPEEQFLYELNNTLLEEFGSTFGQQRVRAELEDGRLVFRTNDTNNITITEGEGLGLANIGGITNGANTAFSTATRLSDFFEGDFFNIAGQATIEINGTNIQLNSDMTVSEMMDAINDSEAGVTMSFNGLNNSIVISGNGTGIESRVRLGSGETSAMFAEAMGMNPGAVAVGQNALVTITGPDGIALQVERESNQFNLSAEIGLNFTVTSLAVGETVTMEISRNTDRTREVITTFVEEYNALVRELADLRNQSRPRGNNGQVFEPLLDHERAEMSESEIRRWEEQSREGMLHRSQEIEFALNQMRRAIHEGIDVDGRRMHLFEFGITMEVAGNLSTLRLNESELDTALSEISEENVLSFFQGLHGNLDEAINRGTEHIRRIAGTDNIQTNTTLFNRINDIDSRLESMEERLRMREQGLFAMFGRLETAIMQSNAQMEMLWQMTGM